MTDKEIYGRIVGYLYGIKNFEVNHQYINRQGKVVSQLQVRQNSDQIVYLIRYMHQIAYGQHCSNAQQQQSAAKLHM